MTEHPYAYAPNYAFPPGETLAELLESRAMTQADLAGRTGLTPKTVNEIVRSKTRITPTTALQLERVLGIPASFWNNLQRRFDEVEAALEEAQRLKRSLSWASAFPIRAMARSGWVEHSRDRLTQLRALLNFFGTASPDAWEAHWSSVQVAFRSVAERPRNDYALACWLRRGEVEAAAIETVAYREDTFRQTLSDVRQLTRLPGVQFLGPLVQHCAQAGVAVVFVPELRGILTYGATRWLSPHKALIQLSLRRKSDDHLWFTFFHEAGHIVLHPKKAVFIEGNDGTNELEEEANRFASDILIPPAEYRAFVARGELDEDAIEGLAERIGVAPGIVVGRLQHDGLLPYGRHNHFKRQYEFAAS
jgi:addiction module HigA family antidote